MDTSDKNTKTKTTSNLEVNLVPKIEKRAWREETLADHFHCILCGSPLHFRHKTDFIKQTVAEIAHCPSCGVKNRDGLHSLQ